MGSRNVAAAGRISHSGDVQCRRPALDRHRIQPCETLDRAPGHCHTHRQRAGGQHRQPRRRPGRPDQRRRRAAGRPEHTVDPLRAVASVRGRRGGHAAGVSHRRHHTDNRRHRSKLHAHRVTRANNRDHRVLHRHPNRQLCDLSQPRRQKRVNRRLRHRDHHRIDPRRQHRRNRRVGDGHHQQRHQLHPRKPIHSDSDRQRRRRPAADASSVCDSGSGGG